MRVKEYKGADQATVSFNVRGWTVCWGAPVQEVLFVEIAAEFPNYAKRL
jgi:hypothetical protein